MQRTKKKVQQSKPNHLVARRLSSQAAPPGTTPPPVARARYRPTPRVCAIHVPFPAPGERRFAGARSPSGKERSQQPATLPSPRRTAAGSGHRWRLEIPEGLRLPSPTPSPGERRGLASEADRGAGGGGPWGGARRRRESILQPFRLLARGARGWRTGRGAPPGGYPPPAPEQPPVTTWKKKKPNKQNQNLIALPWEIVTLTNTPACRGQRNSTRNTLEEILTTTYSRIMPEKIVAPIVILKITVKIYSLPGTCLVVQWLRLHAPNAGGPGSIPGSGK
nr:E3 ubiquitin-protein ligase TRIM13 isoform X2 [Globicephala melas]